EVNTVHGVIQRVLSTARERPGSGKRPDGSIEAGSKEARRQAEEVGEDKLVNLVVLGPETQRVLAEGVAAVVLGLLVVLEGVLRRQQVRTHRGDGAGNADEQRPPIRRKGLRRARLRIGVLDEVVEVQVAEAALVRPAAAGIVNAADMNIRVVAVAEAAQVASAETGHADVVVVHEPIEQAGAPGEVEVGSSCRHLLVHWRGKGAAELRELGNDGEALRVLLVCSYSTCQNSLSLMKGPPARPPKFWRSNGGFAVVGEVLSRRWSAAKRASRKNPKPDPWMSLVPLRVMMFTAPEDVMSVLGSSIDWLMPNSWMDSLLRLATV